MRKEKAITLISLVITIVILIILAGVAIYLSLGNNGLFVKSKEAKEATNKQTATEKINLKITTAQMDKYAEKQVMPTLKELSEVLRDDSEIEYVTEESQVASAKYDVPSENPSSIYTKLNDYPYEFEINAQLQLASIDGVKIANQNINEKILWEGKSEEGSELILKDDLKKYNYIEVYFTNIQNKAAAGIIKFDVKKIIEIGKFDIYDFCGWVFYGTFKYDIENNKFINDFNGQINHELNLKKFCLEIYKIIGY